MWQFTLEQIVDFGSKGPLEKQMQCARTVFLAQTGELFESDKNYEQRMNAFFEWYVIDRILDAGDSVLERFSQECHEGLSERALQSLTHIQKSRVTIFKVALGRGNRKWLVDQLRGTKEEFCEADIVGLDRGDVIIGRAIKEDGRARLTGSTAVIPPAVGELVIQACEGVRKSGRGRRKENDFVLRVQGLVSRAERYAHVDAREIFTADELTS